MTGPSPLSTAAWGRPRSTPGTMRLKVLSGNACAAAGLKQVMRLAVGVALAVAAPCGAFVPTSLPMQASRQSLAYRSEQCLRMAQTEPGEQGKRGMGSSSQAMQWVRSLSRAAMLAVPAALPFLGTVTPRADAVGEEIVKLLQEDTSKKYIDEGGDLVETLKKRSQANKAKNDRERMEKTFLNSEAGIFGPFDKFIPVLTKEGKYVLLLEEEYNRLKDEGKIVGRDFVVDYDAGDATVDEPKQQQEAAEAGLKTPPAEGEGEGADLAADDADLGDINQV